MSWPTELRLNPEKNLLTVSFEDGARYVFGAERLRVESPSAEVRGHVRRRNTLGPTGTLPQELKNAAIDIIIYRAANRLRKKAIAEDKKADNDQALRKLEGAAEGSVAVSAPDNPTTEVTSAPAPHFEKARRRFGWDEERGV